MCGIVGIVAFDSRSRIASERLRRMRDEISHRGPDDQGLDVCGNVGLGHRRLSIIDLRHGRQPMGSSDGNLSIVFNGEIYNYRALKFDLAARGCRFSTHSDTEVILKAYEVFGDDCVNHLRGMFAFAIRDSRRHRIFMARDRLGIKPIYYALRPGELLFASEIKSILAAGAVRPSLNRAVIPEFLANRYVAGPETLFQEIHKLLPGHVLSWSREDGLRVSRYWRLPEVLSPAESSLEEQARELRIRLDEALRTHLVSDVPVGLFLSGGLDSSGLGVLMSRMVDYPIKTFAVGFQDQKIAELPWARMAATAIGSEHHETVVTPQRFFDALPHMVWHEDEPIAFPSSIPLYFVSELARKFVKVVISGEGADELFLGYNRYRVTAWNERLSNIYRRSVPALVRDRLRGRVERLPKSARRYMERSFIGREPGVRDLFFENFSVFPVSMQVHALREPETLIRHDPYARAIRYYESAPGGILERMSHADMQTYLVELLMKQDQMSMAASVESRVPFLDHRFVEYAAAMPACYKLSGWTTKAVLRQALAEELPPALLKRRKMGFPTPLPKWLRGSFSPLVNEFLLGDRALSRSPMREDFVRRMVAEHRDGERNHADRIWLLMNLEVWQRIFFDGERPEAMMEPTAKVRSAAPSPLKLVRGARQA